jgi:hypothetical protein
VCTAITDTDAASVYIYSTHHRQLCLVTSISLAHVSLLHSDGDQHSSDSTVDTLSHKIELFIPRGSHRHTHTHTHAHAHKHTQTHTQTHTHTNTHTHTHKHTHTHTPCARSRGFLCSLDAGLAWAVNVTTWQLLTWRSFSACGTMHTQPSQRQFFQWMSLAVGPLHTARRSCACTSSSVARAAPAAPADNAVGCQHQ